MEFRVPFDSGLMCGIIPKKRCGRLGSVPMPNRRELRSWPESRHTVHAGRRAYFRSLAPAVRMDGTP